MIAFKNACGPHAVRPAGSGVAGPGTRGYGVRRAQRLQGLRRGALDEAQAHVALAEARFGADRIAPMHFRFAASALLGVMTSALVE